MTPELGRDNGKFDRLRLQYGAKAANLILLSEMVGDINVLRNNSINLEIAVPDFRAVPVTLYRAWREGKLPNDNLNPYFEWVSGVDTDYIVRSSAVFSEDGENVTGAGIYASVRVGKGTTFADFKNAVAKVYQSTDSPTALAYRASNRVGQEEMGLVIQKFISAYAPSQVGYVNSRLVGVPDLMEVVTGTSRNFVNREKLNKGTSPTVHHFPPDQFKINPSLISRVTQLTATLERIWGGDIQIEFVEQREIVNVVQVRGLPGNIKSQTTEIKFPDETPIYTGAAIGVGDIELPVLNGQGGNNENIGVVVFTGNYGWTIGIDRYHLPEEGAVIICGSEGRNGHIQTLCAEKGLVCVFPDVNKDNPNTISYRELSKLKKVRIVSNGIEARVYEK